MVAVSAAIVFGTVPGTASAQPPSGTIRPGGAQAIPGSYLVVLRSGTPAQRGVDLATRLGGRVGHVYTSALRGFELTASDATARRIAAHPDVAYVERNSLSTMPAGTDGVQPNPPSW